MKVFVTTESRFERTPDGASWTVSTVSYRFWQRYLDVFDEVRVVGRLREVPVPPAAAVRADGLRVSLHPMPYYVGPWQFARQYFQSRGVVRDLVGADDAAIIRAPGMGGSLLVSQLRRKGHPYGLEVVGDPWQVFAPGSVRTILRPVLRRKITAELKRECGGACAVSYVTSANLQQRYPAAPGAHVTSYSSIDLPSEAFVSVPRSLRPAPQIGNLIFVGSVEQLYKAPDVLIDAVGMAAAKGVKLRLTMIGEGQHIAELKQQAVKLGLANAIDFKGHVTPGKPIRDELDQGDLFVLPSRQEGLPRAMIEAMARALPCIGSDVGGIPELLNTSECVPANDAKALATKIVEVIADAARLARLSEENLQKSRQYSAEVLRPRRRALYQFVKDATLEWASRRHQR